MIPTTLQRYVLKETLRVAALAILALTGMIFVGMSVELVHKGLSVIQLRNLLPFVFAHSLPYALPSSFLVASVFVFGRLSGHNEISAIRASGINLNHVITPVIIVAVLVSIGTFGLNQYLLPWSHGQVRNLTRSLVKTAIKHVGVTHTRFEIDNYLIYVGGLDKDGKWKNVALIKFVHEYPALILLADKGYCRVDEEKAVAVLRLYDGNVFQPQFDEAADKPVYDFKEIEYRIDLHAEKRIPLIGMDARERALIKKSVEKAVYYAGRTSSRLEQGNTLIFFRRDPKEGAWKKVGIVQFTDAEFPARVILADEGRYLVDHAKKTATLRLSNSRAFPINGNELADTPASRFEEQTLTFDLSAPKRVPAEGTNPQELWFRTRPKYLVLPDLLEARRARKAKDKQLRALPEYSGVRHPKTERKIAERGEDKLYREYYNRRVAVQPLAKAVQEASAAIEQTREELQLAQKRHDAVAGLIAGALTDIKERKSYREKLQQQIERTALDAAAFERLKRLKKKVRQTDAQLSRLTAQLKEARSEQARIRQNLTELKTALAPQEETLKDARIQLAEQKHKAGRARAKYDKLRKYVEDLRLIEKRLRADTQFHYRNAGSATTLIFIIIGIPLGILARRGNVIIAFALSFFTVLIVYYPLMIVGQMLSRDGFMTPWLAQWMPNSVVGIVGLILLKWGIRR